ncbi:hypothetical protein [Clostridium felsineum]|uniref:hypothetical protein n=1 Tax=Clostridium felsineum TaxID=36839 RepID=UPI00098BE4D6|nr:hypothetical protein [Clostridium felsineum]URZ16865.1 hypothetical protein CLFE_029120 [Clostridium felsineum DSM 794]
MVKVYYGQTMNAFLGGVMFYDGYAEFEDKEEGVRFANMYYLQYEVIEPEPKKKPSTRKKKVE